MSEKRERDLAAESAPGSLDELARNAELQSVTFLEVHGDRQGSEVAERANDDQPNMKVWYRDDSGQIEVRCRVDMFTPEAHFVADAVAEFSLAVPLPKDAELQRTFTERVGIAVVYPYLRESVQQLAQKLDVSVPVLGLIAHRLSTLQQGTDEAV